PGMRARGYIAQLRENGKPYALDSVFDKGNSYQREGNLADAHLLFFFSAREGYLPAMMKMGELADPILFQAQDSLLDTADGFQAYKWYRKAADLGHAAANERIDRLQDWALAAAKTGDAGARQLLLNFR
ncbi:MAG: deoxyribonuclease, partial [Proteobacteria bacterium]|nr:deoxyribonuclease [Pseudomonadota bacterium]